MKEGLILHWHDYWQFAIALVVSKAEPRFPPGPNLFPLSSSERFVLGFEIVGLSGIYPVYRHDIE